MHWLSYGLAIGLPVFETSGTVTPLVVWSFIFLLLCFLFGWRSSALIMALILDGIEPISWPVWLVVIGVALMLLTALPTQTLVKQYGWYCWVVPGIVLALVVMVVRAVSLSAASEVSWELLGQQIATTLVLGYGIFAAHFFLTRNSRAAFVIE